MEIRTTIKGSHGEDIQILAENATEYTNTMNTLVRQKHPQVSSINVSTTPADVSMTPRVLPKKSADVSMTPVGVSMTSTDVSMTSTDVSTPNKVSKKEIKHVSSSQVKQMKAYKRQGMSTPDIADKMGFAYSTVWRRVHKMAPPKEVSLEEQMQITRLRHKANPPAYHRDCPCCDPTSTTSYDDWLRRSKQARTDRLLAHKRNQ